VGAKKASAGNNSTLAFCEKQEHHQKQGMTMSMVWLELFLLSKSASLT
jgi:hypothetical protein